MTGQELKDFLGTLSEEQLQNEVAVYDLANDQISGLNTIEITTEDIYGTYTQGVLLESSVADYTSDEQDDMADDTYAVVDSGIVLLNIS